MRNLKYKGVSVSVGHYLEWRNPSTMVKTDISPPLRAVDYKLPQNVWYYEEY